MPPSRPARYTAEAHYADQTGKERVVTQDFLVAAGEGQQTMMINPPAP
jgi:hypothetical protein